MWYVCASLCVCGCIYPKKNYRLNAHFSSTHIYTQTLNPPPTLDTHTHKHILSTHILETSAAGALEGLESLHRQVAEEGLREEENLLLVHLGKDVCERLDVSLRKYPPPHYTHTYTHTHSQVFATTLRTSAWRA